MDQSKKVNVAIVGAGLVGTTLSYYLSQNDRINVSVYERAGGNARGTSYANAGRFCPIGKHMIG